MAAGNWLMTDTGRTSLLNGTFDLDTDTFLMALFLSTSNLSAASTTYAALTNQHAAANGYSTGGISMGVLTLAGTTTVTIDDPADLVWTAAGGSITAKWAVIYESAGNILFYCQLDAGGADVTATDGNTLTVALHSSGIATLA
jgi:acyl CoA:acetate/3-ketoacid CoA transferase